MSITFREVRRENVPLLIGVAGGTGSGKTYSALRIARGITGGQPFAFVDTENGRAKHYADLFPEMRHGEIHAPFRPAAYAEAILAGAEQFPVVVVDSMSHEWAGDGGCLDWHDELMGGDQKKNLSAWILPKRDHKAMVTRLLQVNAHVILCFRAEPKVEVGPGNTIRPKASLTGLDGWIPISEKMLPYELTASFLLMADKPGVPLPIKLQEQHRALVPLGEPLSEATGAALAEWAAGSSAPAFADVDWTEADLLVPVLLAYFTAEQKPAVQRLVDANRRDHPGSHVGWLQAQITKKDETPAPVDEPEQESFPIPEGARA